jgi:hypothetical protein
MNSNDDNYVQSDSDNNQKNENNENNEINTGININNNSENDSENDMNIVNGNTDINMDNSVLNNMEGIIYLFCVRAFIFVFITYALLDDFMCFT